MTDKINLNNQKRPKQSLHNKIFNLKRKKHKNKKLISQLK